MPNLHFSLGKKKKHIAPECFVFVFLLFLLCIFFCFFQFFSLVCFFLRFFFFISLIPFSNRMKASRRHKFRSLFQGPFHNSMAFCLPYILTFSLAFYLAFCMISQIYLEDPWGTLFIICLPSAPSLAPRVDLSTCTFESRNTDGGPFSKHVVNVKNLEFRRKTRILRRT